VVQLMTALKKMARGGDAARQQRERGRGRVAGFCLSTSGPAIDAGRALHPELTEMRIAAVHH
jgi:hypothetical protein